MWHERVRVNIVLSARARLCPEYVEFVSDTTMWNVYHKQADKTVLQGTNN